MEEKIMILVVDDEKVVRDGCIRVLTGKGYEVLTSENGKQCMDTLEKESVDIILLDLKMPGMSGEEVLRKTREQYPDIPVIIITGHGTVDTAVECMKIGAYDFITKPFQVDQFVLTVKRAADKRLLEQRARKFEEENIKNLYDLNLEKSRLKTIINCMANGVMVTNLNLEVVLHNPSLMRLMEIDKNLENPIPLPKIVKNDDFFEMLKKLQSEKTANDEFISLEFVTGKHSLRAISAPALGPDGNLAGTVTVIEDITLFKQLDEMKSDFINMVAHEIRSPMVAIRQQNSVMIEGLAGPLGDKQQDLIQKATKKIDSLLELINDLLDISKIESGKAVQHQVPTDIGPIITDTLGLMEARAKKENIELEFNYKDLKPVQADPQQMEEVFNNLISNAINYSPDGGKIKVSTNTRGEFLEIKVNDTGMGIAAEELPKIFDKFYRVKSPGARQIMGTGLGLSIVKGIVESHRGTIDVDSEPGKGTTFRILLPIIKS
ncbi:response regulator [Thermodesulfobacteriota bacterium]